MFSSLQHKQKNPPILSAGFNPMIALD